MFDVHRLEFDIYFSNYENDVISSLLNIALENHITVHRMIKTGYTIYHYKVVFKGVSKVKFQALVLAFIYKCGSKMNHVSFK